MLQVGLYKRLGHALQDVQGFGGGIPPGPAPRQGRYFGHVLVILRALTGIVHNIRQFVAIHFASPLRLGSDFPLLPASIAQAQGDDRVTAGP